MHLLLNILKNPENWSNPEDYKNSEVMSPKQQAIEYNEKLRQTKGVAREQTLRPGESKHRTIPFTQIVKENEVTIQKDNCMKIVMNGILMQLSLKSLDFAKDIKDALTQLR